jgi:hypothetical protein
MPDRSTLRSTLNEALKAKAGCLTPLELEKLAKDTSPKDAHLAQCSRCQTELALLKSFESDAPLPDEGAAVTWISARLERNLGQIKGSTNSRDVNDPDRLGSWFSRLLGARRSQWLVPIAAALLIAVALTGVELSRRSGEPQLRADAGNGAVIYRSQVYRSQEVEVTGPTGDLMDAPKTLEWKAFPGATEYRVSIMEVDEVPLWSGQTNDATVTIPVALQAKMLPGKPMLWRVTALDSQGQVLAASQVQRFSVQRKSSGSTNEVLPR